jgi:hypothetical protein
VLHDTCVVLERYGTGRQREPECAIYMYNIQALYNVNINTLGNLTIICNECSQITCLYSLDREARDLLRAQMRRRMYYDERAYKFPRSRQKRQVRAGGFLGDCGM